MTRQKLPQRYRRTLIEKYAHLRRGQSAAGSVLQHGARLLQRDTREQFNDLADWHAIFEVLEEGRDRYTRTAEHPGTADTFGIAFHRRAA